MAIKATKDHKILESVIQVILKSNGRSVIKSFDWNDRISVRYSNARWFVVGLFGVKADVSGPNHRRSFSTALKCTEIL